MPELLKMGQLREVLKVSESTAYRLVWSGTIPSIKVGQQRRVRREDLLAYINRKAG